jgi:ribosome-associated toxin RatA of RatAB toxin-antitoxin module
MQAVGHRLPGFFGLLALALPVLADAADITVEVVRRDDSFEVEAGAEIPAQVDVAWEVLTDYDRLAEFIPGMTESRVVSRAGRSVVVDQRGKAGLLFFTFPIEVRLEIEESPYGRIESRAIRGNFRELTGAYDLQVRGDRLSLRYSGRLTPDFGIPPLIGTLLVRNTVEKRFGAMVDEIKRRQRVRSASPGSGS